MLEAIINREQLLKCLESVKFCDSKFYNIFSWCLPSFPIFKCVCEILTPFMSVPIIIIHNLSPHLIALEIGQPSNITLASLNADVHKRGRATQKIRSFVMKANSCAQSKLILEHKKIKAARNVWELLCFLGNLI